MIHIDYNVCFDRGQQLKVPETVPFRLTPMLQDALGICGINGMFRNVLEDTLRVVGRPESCEAILTLMESFIYDPLVEWTVRKDSQSQERSRMELNVNLALFLSRAEERRSLLEEFGKVLVTCVSGFKAQNLRFQNDYDAIVQSFQLIDEMQQQEIDRMGTIEWIEKHLGDSNVRREHEQQYFVWWKRTEPLLRQLEKPGASDLKQSVSKALEQAETDLLGDSIPYRSLLKTCEQAIKSLDALQAQLDIDIKKDRMDLALNELEEI